MQKISTNLFVLRSLIFTLYLIAQQFVRWVQFNKIFKVLISIFKFHFYPILSHNNIVSSLEYEIGLKILGLTRKGMLNAQT